MHSDANNVLANDIMLIKRETLQRNSESFDLKYQSLKIRSQTLHAYWSLKFLKPFRGFLFSSRIGFIVQSINYSPDIIHWWFVHCS